MLHEIVDHILLTVDNTQVCLTKMYRSFIDKRDHTIFPKSLNPFFIQISLLI